MGIFSKRPKEGLQIKSTSDGKAVKIETLKDGVFSEKMMGDGVVIQFPKGTKKVDVLAPIDGTMATVFHTGHAYGIRAKDGTEVLVHLGVDTVNLNGKGFENTVKQDQKVKAGDKMGTIDVEFVRKNAPSADAIIIITSGHNITDKKYGDVKAGETIITL